MRWKTASGKTDSKSSTPWIVKEKLNVESNIFANKKIHK